MLTLWIHKVNIHKTVYLLHQFHRCEGFSFYLLCGIRSGGRFPIDIDRLSKAAVAPELVRLFQ